MQASWTRCALGGCGGGESTDASGINGATSRPMRNEADRQPRNPRKASLVRCESEVLMCVYEGFLGLHRELPTE